MLNQTAVNGILADEAQAAQTQQQLSTGKSINSPADNPVGEVQLLELNKVNSQNQQYISNGQSANTNLSLAMTALSQSNNTLQAIRDLVVQANSGTNTTSDLQDIATQISALEGQLQGTANSQNAQGQYLFSGFSTSTQPFVRGSSGSISYVGDSGSNHVPINGGTSVQTGDPGSTVFMNITGGNGLFTTAAGSANTGTGVVDPGSVTSATAWQTAQATAPAPYTITFTSATAYQITDANGNAVGSPGTYASNSGSEIQFNGVEVGITGAPAAGDTFKVSPATNQSVFDTLDKLVSALNGAGTGSASKAQLSSTLGASLQQIDNSINHMSNASANVGARINLISSVADTVNTNSTAVSTQISKIGDLDYASAASKYSQQLVALQAAEQSYAAIDGLSLFKVLAGG
jgi:flagellar hook-associated protein 3 FlgL